MVSKRRPRPEPSAATDRPLVAIAATSVVLLLVTASLRRIWETDFWWQYATGALVAAKGIPHVDPWSFVSRGRPWIEMRWLYCDLLYRIGHAFGFDALVVLKSVAVVAIFALVAAASRAVRAPVTALVVLVPAILAASQRFYLRPELASFVFVAAFLFVIARWRERGGRLLWLLPLMQVAWSNLHTQFLLGPALVGLLLVVELAVRRQRLATIAAVLAATAAACLVTPFGLRGITFGLGLAGELNDPVFKALSDELKGPFAFGSSYAAVFWFEVLLGIVIVSALTNLRRLDAYWTALVFSQLGLALTSIRNLPLFSIAAVPFVIDNALRSPWLAALGTHRVAPWTKRLALLAVSALSLTTSLALVTDRFNVEQHDTNQFGTGIATHRYPEAAARRLREQRIAGPLFNSMFAGSYLVAQGADVFIDPRLEVHGSAFLDQYRRMMSEPAAWQEADRKYGFKSALVELPSPFLRYLGPSDGWRLVFFDDTAAVYVRDAAVPRLDVAATARRARENLPSPRAYAEAGWFGRVVSPAPYLRLAQFLAGLGEVELAEPFAKDALAAFPAHPGAHAILGQACEKRRDASGALGEYEAELALAPGNTYARRQAGLLQFQAGHAERALELLTRSVADVPGDPLPWAVLTKLHADAGRTADALRCAERAAALEPGNASYLASLGRLQGVAGQLDAAIATLTDALQRTPSDAVLRGDLATFLLDRGRRGEAFAEIDRALALAPGDVNLQRIRAGMERGGVHSAR